MATTQGSTLFQGDVTAKLIYLVMQGTGFGWAQHCRFEVRMGGKPRQLTRAKHKGNPIQHNIKNPRGKDFEGKPGVVIDGRLISVSPFIVLDSIDETEWKDTFPEYQPGGPNNKLVVSPKIRVAVFNLIKDAVLNQMNELHGSGDTSIAEGSPEEHLRFYDGFITHIINDVDATEVGMPTALNEGNILDRVYEIRRAIPPRIKSKTSLKIFCSYDDLDIYDVARRRSQDNTPETDITASSSVNQAAVATKITLIPNEGIPKDFMFATIADTTATSNLVQGFWMKDEEESMLVYKETPADQEVKIVMRFDTGTQHVTGDDIFYVTGPSL